MNTDSLSRGKPHKVWELILKFREIFLDLGFDEVINPIFIPEDDIYLQYGKEAPLILDRVYYIAGLDRADIGIDKEKIAMISKIIPGFDKDKENIEKLKEVLRRFKKREIEDAEDLLEEFLKIGIYEDKALQLLDEVFYEFKELVPIPKKITLRSHMTGAWFRTLSLWEEYPAKLFSIGQRFRREQRQDKSHLFESTSASLVIMDDNFDISQGGDLTKEILKRLGFNFCDFRVKPITSNYYEIGTDTEVYIKDDRNNLVEVANLGFYAKQALENYRIKHKVFNVGFGVERIAGILFKTDDIRLLVYPYLQKEKILTDEEIANQIDLFKQPRS